MSNNFEFIWDIAPNLSDSPSYIYIQNVEIAAFSFRYDADTKTLLAGLAQIPEELQKQLYTTNIYHQLLHMFDIDRIESRYEDNNFEVYQAERNLGKSRIEAVKLTPSGKIISRTNLFVLLTTQETNYYVDIVWQRK